jgi:uncharacterized protein YjbI with pentapeptide repeats
MEKKETCPECGQPKGLDNFVCPNCGHIYWGNIIKSFILGIVLVWVFFRVAPGISSDVWRGIVRWSTGIYGFGSILVGVVGLIQANGARKRSLPKPADKPQVHNEQFETRKEISGANNEHVAKWKEGADAWIDWREQNPEIQPNLSGADLKGTNLAGVDLKNVDLSGADLSGVDLSTVHFMVANLSNAKLVGADLSYSVHRLSTLRDADLSLANLNNADLSTIDLNGANLQNANLSEANLNSTFLRGANLRFANLYGTNLSKADCREANLSGADLSNANLNMTFYNKRTVWPAGFSPLEAGALME